MLAQVDIVAKVDMVGAQVADTIREIVRDNARLISQVAHPLSFL